MNASTYEPAYYANPNEPDDPTPEVLDRRRKLVALLRSGEIAQARSTLRRHDAMCCLGVACELYRRETGMGRWQEPSDTQCGNGVQMFVDDTREQSHSYMTLDVANWFGLRGRNPVLTKTNLTMAQANDDMSWSFNKIADAFEARYIDPLKADNETGHA